MTTALMSARSAGHALALESDAWIRLSGTGREREDAIEGLRAARAGGPLRGRPPAARRYAAGSAGFDDLAVQAADDALVAILTKLHTYRGDSRFTTGPTSSPCSKRL